MEHHRLKPMGNYPVELFNSLYKQTHGLRRKLASQVDPRKFGVDYHEVLSWFDVKFIFVFSKYWQSQPEKLLGYIISGLTTYKQRIIMNSYQHKWKDYAHKLDVDDMWDNPIKDDESETAQKREFYMSHIDEFMKQNLSNDAYLLFTLQLTPPPFISERMRSMGLKPTSNIPTDLFVDYLELEPNKSSETYVNGLRMEIKSAQQKCTIYYRQHPVTYQYSQN